MAKKKESQVEETQAEEVVAPAVEEKPAKAEKKPAKKAEKMDLSKVDAKDIAKMRQDYFQHRLNVMLGKENHTAQLKAMRKDIARALMYLHMNKQK